MATACKPHPISSILVVDDSTVQRDHTVNLCRALGVQTVLEADSGGAALKLLSTLAPMPALMIVDIEMPGMDGLELIEQLRIRNIQIAMVVASGRESALIDSVQAIGASLGFDMLAGLEKPLTLASLGNALNGRRLPAAAAVAENAPPIAPDVLEEALDQKQISVHYQPKVDIRTGLVRGVEALARWSHPAQGAIAPPHFIALAEQYGLIQQLIFNVMEQALEQTAAWNSRGLRLTMAVNLSPRLLDRPGLARDIMALVQQFAVPPDQLVFEIAESSLADTGDGARALLARLRLRGFGLAIDDYGTGCSSMQQLARIPFTELKIDREFVHEATGRKDLRVMLKASIDMAHRLGLVSTAEGIETLQDWRLLQRLGCMVGQGRLIARPMAGADIPAWLKQHRRRVDTLRAPKTGKNGAPGQAPACAAA